MLVYIWEKQHFSSKFTCISMPASVHILKYLNILWYLETKLAHAVNDFDESKWRV